MTERWRASARTAGGVFLFLALVWGALSPATHDWQLPLGFAVAGIGMYLAASTRIYRPALTRTPEAITCRYNPWREGTFVMLITVLAGTGFGSIYADSARVRLAGVILLVMLPVALAFHLWKVWRCRLRITAGDLTISKPGQRDPITLSRPAVLSVAAGTGRYGNITGPVTQLAYLPAGPAPATPATLLIGGADSRKATWITINQDDLVAALQQWKDGDPRDPALLDRVEALLRGAGTPAAGVAAMQAGAPAAEAPTGPPADVASGAPGALGGPSPAVPAAAPRYDYPAAPLEAAPAIPPPPAARPSSWRWVWWAVVGIAALAAAAATPMLHSTQRSSAPPTAVAGPSPAVAGPSPTPTGCPAAGGGAGSALPKKSGAEPTIYLPLAPGWIDLPATTPPDPADAATARAYFENTALRDNGFTPYVRVHLTSTTDRESAQEMADRLAAKLRASTTVTTSVATVCGSTVYRTDTTPAPGDPAGQTGTTLFTVVEGADGVRWVAIATLKTQNPDNPDYRAQRDALVNGFHASLP